MSGLPVTGARVGLRELRPADEAVFVRIHTSRVLTRYLGTDRMDEPQARAAFVRALAQQAEPRRRRHTLAITRPGEDAPQGLIALLVEEFATNAMIGSLVILPGSPVRGHGAEAGRLLMAYGFEHLGLHRIWAGHRADHVHMATVMRDAGLHPEATLREVFRTQGRWHDVSTYAALSHEWRTAQQASLVGASALPN